MIITARITDPVRFIEYGKAAGQLVASMGGEYIVMRPSTSETLEGDWDEENKTVVSKWPSFDAARAFWNSPEYAEIKKLRDGAAIVTVRLHNMAPAL